MDRITKYLLPIFTILFSLIVCTFIQWKFYVFEKKIANNFEGVEMPVPASIERELNKSLRIFTAQTTKANDELKKVSSTIPISIERELNKSLITLTKQMIKANNELQEENYDLKMYRDKDQTQETKKIRNLIYNYEDVCVELKSAYEKLSDTKNGIINWGILNDALGVYQHVEKIISELNKTIVDSVENVGVYRFDAEKIRNYHGLNVSLIACKVYMSNNIDEMFQKCLDLLNN